ncbi:MAG: RDD family protein [Betaproteobacteria bacterium HGW-Betaproteobacteria-22]|nr:MAG: RDD family protein [Betaproteobacteria bacterium HGW-Betaproteobacteria-22]
MPSQQNIEGSPGILKLGASLIYEVLTVTALSFLVVFVFIFLFGDATAGARHWLLQLVLWLGLGAYFVWCWINTGRTLAMQAWRMRVVDQYGRSLPLSVAVLRYMLASISVLCLGFGFLWALLDREHRYLHDRVLKSRIILENTSCVPARVNRQK